MVWLDALIAGDNFDLLSPWPYTWNPRLKHCDDTAAIRAAMEHCVAKQDDDCPGATKMGYNTTVTGAPAFETALQDQIEVLKDLERQCKEKAERLQEESRKKTEKLLGLRTDEARLSKELEVVKDNIKKLKPDILRVDNVEYDITLYVDDKDLKKTVFYDRGSATWTEGISDKDVRRGADGTVLQGWSDWCITIADGTVDMKIRSEKFYSNYMTRMLNALKERVPSLHGYVSCRDGEVDIYWTITNKVRRFEREEWALTAEARQAYCSARFDQVYKQRHCSNTRKRRLGEEKPKESDEDSGLQ